MALGESVFGAGRGLRDVLCAAFGTGVGGGLVLEQRLYRGRHGFAGEIGLMGSPGCRPSSATARRLAV